MNEIIEEKKEAALSNDLIDISSILDHQRISSFNVKLLILAFLVMMTDGFDLGAAAFAGPGLIKEWSLKGPGRYPAE